MDNSFSLGALHGILYAVTPSVPWLMAFKRYITAGPQKGGLAFAGTLFGQITLLWLSFCGWKEVVWLWFYFEPLLMTIGWIGVLVTVRELVALNISARRLRMANIRTRREGFRYFMVGMAWVFCNPGTLGGTDLLFGEVPTDRSAYLIAFIVLSTMTFALIWSFAFSQRWGLRVNQFKLANSQFNYHLERSEWFFQPLALVLVVALLLEHATLGDEPHLTYHYDNLIGYTPFEKLTYQYSRDLVWQTDLAKEEKQVNQFFDSLEDDVPATNGNGDDKVEDDGNGNGNGNGDEEIDEDEFVEEEPEMEEGDIALRYGVDEGELEEEEEAEEPEGDFYQTNFDWNEGTPEERSPLPATAITPWNAGLVYGTFNKRIERELPEHWELVERRYYEFNRSNQLTVHTRLHPLRLFLFPHWEKTQDYVTDLAKMRSELDQKVEAQDVKVQHMMFPDNKEYDVDILLKEPQGLNWPAQRRLRGVSDLNGDLTENTYQQLHQGYRGALEENMSLAKLQKLPKEVRFPWDFPRVEKTELPSVSRPTLADTEGVEAIEEVSTQLTNYYVRFLDPIALNSRLRTNDPDAFGVFTEPGAHDDREFENNGEKFDLWVRDAYQRAWHWETTHQLEVLEYVPSPDDTYLPKKVPTQGLQK